MKGSKCYFCDKKVGNSHKQFQGEKDEVKITVNLCALCAGKLEWILGFQPLEETQA